jgi:hypothetical protein
VPTTTGRAPLAGPGRYFTIRMTRSMPRAV